jgi:hypothetical protein
MKYKIDIQTGLEISVSSLKGKLLGFIYWKRRKIVPARAIHNIGLAAIYLDPSLKSALVAVEW